MAVEVIVTLQDYCIAARAGAQRGHPAAGARNSPPRTFRLCGSAVARLTREHLPFRKGDRGGGTHSLRDFAPAPPTHHRRCARCPFTQTPRMADVRPLRGIRFNPRGGAPRRRAGPPVRRHRRRAAGGAVRARPPQRRADRLRPGAARRPARRQRPLHPCRRATSRPGSTSASSLRDAQPAFYVTEHHFVAPDGSSPGAPRGHRPGPRHRVGRERPPPPRAHPARAQGGSARPDAGHRHADQPGVRGLAGRGRRGGAAGRGGGRSRRRGRTHRRRARVGEAPAVGGRRPVRVAALHHAFAPARLYIVDGHHRYETAAAYAAERAAAGDSPDAELTVRARVPVRRRRPRDQPAPHPPPGAPSRGRGLQPRRPLDAPR